MKRYTIACSLLLSSVYGGAITPSQNPTTTPQEEMNAETTNTISNIANNGQNVNLSDGSNWMVNPDDLSTMATWNLTNEVTATYTPSTSATPNNYPYTLYNHTTGTSVRAQRMGQGMMGPSGQSNTMNQGNMKSPTEQSAPSQVYP